MKRDEQASDSDGVIMFCTTVIPTIGRPSLSRAVESVLEQGFTAAGYEVIVVNDSGRPLPAASWQRSERVLVLHTDRRDKSVARNTGAAIARGEYLHFLDDDDWLLPDALESLWQLARATGAEFIYGNSQLVDRRGNPVVRLDHDLAGNCFIQVMAGEWIPVGAFLVRAKTFFAVGGFNPLMPAGEDMDLYRRVALWGDFANTSSVVLCAAMGQENSSTNYSRLPAYSREAREGVLDEPTAFARMRDSAHNNYWRGRVVRAYVTSVAWNLQHRKLFTAASRATFGLKSLVLSGRHLFSADFWRAVTKPHKSFSFSRGPQEASIPD